MNFGSYDLFGQTWQDRKVLVVANFNATGACPVVGRELRQVL
jgi:hypothetical protein